MRLNGRKISRSHPPTPPISIQLSTPFVWSHMVAPTRVCISCVCVCHCCQPAKTKRAHEGSTGGAGEDAHAQVDGGRTRDEKNEGREAPAVSFWSAAKCSQRSDGKARAVHLFKPAGRRLTSDTPPRGGDGGSAGDGFICCRRGRGSGGAGRTMRTTWPPSRKSNKNGSAASGSVLKGSSSPGRASISSSCPFIRPSACCILYKQHF